MNWQEGATRNRRIPRHKHAGNPSRNNGERNVRRRKRVCWRKKKKSHKRSRATKQIVAVLFPVFLPNPATRESRSTSYPGPPHTKDAKPLLPLSSTHSRATAALLTHPSPTPYQNLPLFLRRAFSPHQPP